MIKIVSFFFSSKTLCHWCLPECSVLIVVLIVLIGVNLLHGGWVHPALLGVCMCVCWLCLVSRKASWTTSPEYNPSAMDDTPHGAFRVDKNHYKILIIFVQKHFFIEIAFAQVNVELCCQRKKKKPLEYKMKQETWHWANGKKLCIPTKSWSEVYLRQ